MGTKGEQSVSVSEAQMAEWSEKSVTDEVLAEVRNQYRKSYIDFLEFVHSIEEPAKFVPSHIEVCMDMIKTLAVRATTVHIVTGILEREQELKYRVQ